MKKCAICKIGKLNQHETKRLFNLLTSRKLVCAKCDAIFEPKAYGFKLDLTNSKRKSRFNGETLDEDDWSSVMKKDKTIREVEIENFTKGKLPIIRDVPIILKKDEVAHMLEESKLRESRAVRRYGGGSVRIAKGVSIRMGQAESHQAIRLIDTGQIILTNRRFVFLGNKRTTNINLNKIINITEYKNSFQINRENKQKPEHFTTTDPEIWTIAISVAASKLKS